MKLPWWFTVVGILLGGMTVAGLGWVSLQAQRAELRHWQDSTDADHRVRVAQLEAQRQAARLTELAAAAKAREDSARAARAAAEAVRIRQSLTPLRVALDSARSAADSLPALVAVVRTQDSVIAAQDMAIAAGTEAIRSQAARAGRLEAMLILADSAIAARDDRIRELTAKIDAIATPSTPRLFGIKLPGRATFFALGAAAGLAAASR